MYFCKTKWIPDVKIPNWMCFSKDNSNQYILCKKYDIKVIYYKTKKLKKLKIIYSLFNTKHYKHFPTIPHMNELSEIQDSTLVIELCSRSLHRIGRFYPLTFPYENIFTLLTKGRRDILEPLCRLSKWWYISHKTPP